MWLSQRMGYGGMLCVLLLGGVPAAAAQEIGVVLAGSRGPFWKAVEQGIADAAATAGLSIAIRSPPDDDARTVEQDLQIKMVDYLLAGGARSLILAPMPVHDRPTPIRLPVPVVLVDRPSAQFAALSTVATDNYAAGRAAGLSLRGVLPPHGKVGVLRLAPHVVSTTAREAGFVDAARELGAEVVLDVYLGHGIREAQSGTAAALAGHAGKIDALFGPTDNQVLGALWALEALAPSQRPRVVGFDYRAAFEPYLRSGALHAVVVQDPFQIGYRAVQQLVHARAGRPVEPEVKIDVYVITGANLETPDIRRMLRYHGS